MAVNVTQNGNTFPIPGNGDTDWGDGFTRWVQDTSASIASLNGATAATPWLSVKAYGATGNGTTDDTAAIRATIAAVAVAGALGGTVYFPKGTYKCLSTLQIGVLASQSNVTLQGEGTSSRLVQSGAFGSTPLLEFRNCDFWGVDGLYLDGSSNSGTGDLLLVDGCSNGTLADCKLAGSKRYGVQLAQINGASLPLNNTTQGNTYLSNASGNLFYAPAAAVLASDDGLDMLAGATPFSLKRFGAKGDGSDESAIFTKAEAAAYAAGGQVYVPPGVFTALNLSTRVSVYGPGTLKMKVQSTNDATTLRPLLTVVADDVTLSGVTFDGDRLNQRFLLQDSAAGAWRAALVMVNSCNRFVCSGCHFKNSRHAGLTSAVSFTQELTTATINGFTVTGCTFKDITGGGCAFFGQAPAIGSNVITSGGLVFTGNYLENVGGYDYLSPPFIPNDGHFYGEAFTGGWLKSAVFSGNVFESVGRACLKPGIIVDCAISGNTFRNSFWNAVQFQPANPGGTWAANTTFAPGAQIFVGLNVYHTAAGGITPLSGGTAPTHTSGTVYDGPVVGGNPTGVAWTWDFTDHTVDYNGSLSISGNTFYGCGAADGDATNAHIGGAIGMNGSAVAVYWQHGVLNITDNAITNCPPSSALSAGHDCIFVQGSSHYRVVNVSGNTLKHVARNGITVEVLDQGHSNIGYKETVTIRNNTVDLTGFRTTAAGVFVFSASSMTTGSPTDNRLLQLDISGNTCIGATHGIELQYDPARNITLTGNKIRQCSAEAVYWLEASTPLSAWVDGNVVTEFVPSLFMNIQAANVRLGNNNRCSTPGSFVNVASPTPAGFQFSTTSPLGWFRLGDTWRNSAVSMGGNAEWTCTTAGFATPTKWVPGLSVPGGVSYCHNAGIAYTVALGGTTSCGHTPPTHGAGTVSDDAISWTFVGTHAVFSPTGQAGAAADIGDALPVGVSVSALLGGQVKLAVAKEAWTAAAASQALTLFSLPAKTRVTKAVLEVTAGFTGVATLQLSLGTNSSTYNNLVAAFDSSSTGQWGLADADMGAALTRAAAIQGGYLPSWSGATALKLLLTGATNLGNAAGGGVGPTTNLTAGVVNVYLTLEKYA